MEDSPNRERPGFVPGPRDVTETPGRAQSAAPAERPGNSCPLVWPLDAAARALGRFAAAGDAPEAVATATEAVWWITTTDAAMNRHHPAARGHVLTALDPAARRAVEVSLTGLRFIRGQLGGNADPADFLECPPAAGSPPAWTWSRFSRRRARSAPRTTTPYREYRAQLAGRPVEDTLKRAADFLSQAHAAASAAAHR